MNKNMKKLMKSAESAPIDILVIAFCAISCGAQTYLELEIFGKAKYRCRMAFQTLV
jgi:hypothetical protein